MLPLARVKDVYLLAVRQKVLDHPLFRDKNPRGTTNWANVYDAAFSRILSSVVRIEGKCYFLSSGWHAVSNDSTKDEFYAAVEEVDSPVLSSFQHEELSHKILKTLDNFSSEDAASRKPIVDLAKEMGFLVSTRWTLDDNRCPYALLDADIHGLVMPTQSCPQCDWTGLPQGDMDMDGQFECPKCKYHYIPRDENNNEIRVPRPSSRSMDQRTCEGMMTRDQLER